MSNVSVGDSRQKRAVGWLEAHEYLTTTAQKAATFIGKGRWVSRRVDLWGCIDIAALHATKPVRIVQVGAAGHASGKRKKVLAKLASVLTPEALEEGPHFDVEVWLWGRWPIYSGFGFSLERYDRDAGDFIPADHGWISSRDAPLPKPKSRSARRVDSLEGPDSEGKWLDDINEKEDRT